MVCGSSLNIQPCLWRILSFTAAAACLDLATVSAKATYKLLAVAVGKQINILVLVLLGFCWHLQWRCCTFAYVDLLSVSVRFKRWKAAFVATFRCVLLLNLASKMFNVYTWPNNYSKWTLFEHSFIHKLTPACSLSFITLSSLAQIQAMCERFQALDLTCCNYWTCSLLPGQWSFATRGHGDTL